MFLATEVVEEASVFHAFDIFMVLFTIVIAIGLYRLLRAPEKNKFAIGFAGVCLLVFLIADAIMVLGWFGAL